jgi:hypothetical protein
MFSPEKDVEALTEDLKNTFLDVGQVQTQHHVFDLKMGGSRSVKDSKSGEMKRKSLFDFDGDDCCAMDTS